MSRVHVHVLQLAYSVTSSVVTLENSLCVFRRPLVGALVLNVGILFCMIATGVLSSHYKQQPMSLGIGLSFQYACYIEYSSIKLSDCMNFTCSAAVDKLTDAGNLAFMPGYSNDTNVTTATMQPDVTTATMQPDVTTANPLPPGPSVSDQFWSDIYAKPWCRMGAYFVGILAGLIMFKSNTRVRMNKVSY